MESFYGGRQGASFVIKGTFKFITDATRYEVDKGWVFVDEYYGQAWNELSLLKEYENGNTSAARKKELEPYLPKKNGTVYTAAKWEEELTSQTMSVYFNDYNYKDIWYGEYCIIDPANKNNRNNGKIYRRTLKGAGDEDITGGVAEYIGQIVGPAGPTPQLKKVDGVDATEESFQSLVLGLDDEVRFINEKNYWDESKDPGDKIKVNKLGKEIKLIPGSETRESYPNHKNEYFEDGKMSSNNGNKHFIQNGGYNWYDVRINNSTDDISQIYIGFDFPYYVTDIVAGDTLPDIGQVETIRQVNTVASPYGMAPFYEKYKINIPRGVRGSWFEDIKPVKREDSSSKDYYLPSAIQYNLPSYTPLTDAQKDYTYTENHYSEDGFSFVDTKVSKTDWPIGAMGWVGTFYWRSYFKTKVSGFKEVIITNGVETETNNPSYLHKLENVFLGLDRHIKNISFSDTGTLTFEYDAWTKNELTNAPTDNTTNNTTGVRVNGQNLDYLPQFETWIKKVDWIKKIEVSGAPALSHINDADTDAELESDYYNVNSSDVNHRVPQGDVLKLTFNNETVNGTNADNNTAYEKNLRLITGIKTFKDGSLRVYRSDGTVNDFDKRINWIDGISTDRNNKKGVVNSPKDDTLIIHFNNDNFGFPSDQIEKNLRLITGIKINENGIVEITRSDGTGHTSGGNPVTGSITSSIPDDQISDLGPQLGWVKQVYRTSKDSPTAYYNAKDSNGMIKTVDVYHLLIRFNNPSVGQSINLPQITMKDPSNPNGATWDDWFDLGVVQETINGLFFDEDSLKIYWNEGQTAPSYFSEENAPQLNWADYQLTQGSGYEKYHRGLDGRAVIATIIKRKDDGTPYSPEKMEKVIFYYVSGEDGYTGWKVLSTYGEDSSVVIRSTNRQIEPETIVVEDVFSAPNNTLSKPWSVV